MQLRGNFDYYEPAIIKSIRNLTLEETELTSLPQNKCLIQTLKALSRKQFEELIFTLKPSGIPSKVASQIDQAIALLNWVEEAVEQRLPELERSLGKIIATDSNIAEQLTAVAIDTKVDSSISGNFQAFIQPLRNRTGDKAIDVEFLREADQTFILSGSLEGLTKLQELFEAGELDFLEIPSVKAVYRVDYRSPDSRKARLIQVLKFRQYSLTSARALARALAHTLSYANTLALALTHTLSFERNLTLDLSLANPLDRAINRARSRNRARALDLVRVIPLSLTITRALDITRVLDSFHASDPDLDRGLDLRDADLRGGNLRNVDLSNADLSGADLTNADVTRTIFGDNLGLTALGKRNLEQRGAILLDPNSALI